MSSNSTNLRHRFLVSASWMVALRWAIKGIGLVNTFILARLLLPGDFGLMAMATMGMAFIEIWLALGVDLALIQKQRTDREDYDTAWSLKLAQGILVGFLVEVTAPWAVEYFNEPRVKDLLDLLALCAVLTGANNIGIVEFRKKLDFQREFTYSLVGRLVNFFVTIGLAFWLRNYWAMIIGLIANQVTAWVLSYTMHKYRPRLCFSRLRQLWQFSKWMLVVNIGLFVGSRLDEFIAVRLVSSANFGIYNVSSDLAQIPANELSLPVSRALVPVLSKMQDDPERLWSGYVKAMAGVNTITLPAGIGMALVAPQLVPLLLGAGWLDAIPFVQIIACYSAIRFVFSGSYNALTAQGKVKTFAAMLWLEIYLLLVLGVLGGHYFSLIGVAWARLAATVLVGLVVMGLIYRHGRITPFAFLSKLLRPAISCVVMAEAVGSWPQHLFGNPLLDLLASVGVGGISYAVTLVLIWLGLGAPEGVERMVMSMLKKKLRPSTVPS